MEYSAFDAHKRYRLESVLRPDDGLVREEGIAHERVAPPKAGTATSRWYRDILADPVVEVQVRTKKIQARARTATGAERTRLWDEALKFWPPYADYQRKTEREIPVVVLEPLR
jgi:proline iminopeptidase